MKRLGMILVALTFVVTSGFAKTSQRDNMGNEPYNFSFERLGTYLQLTPAQTNEVFNISQYFTCQLNEGAAAQGKVKEKKLHNALYGNLKLMKQALTQDQYRKYVALINVTNNNHRILNSEHTPDLYLAGK